MRILFIILLTFTFFVDISKGEEDRLAIKLTDSTPVQYCNAPVPFAESLTIEGNFILPGMKVSINEGYNAGEDTLVYSGSIGNIVSTWYDLQGYLLLKGDANTTIDNYRDAIKLVKYKNNKLIPTLGTRKLTITLEDGDYYWGTGHFYRFVSKSGIKWAEAEAEAKSDAMKYYGLRGYLATITSMYENSFIQTKIDRAVGWIGASDADVEGDWRWVTGPEGLEGGGKGLRFWKGTGYQAKMNNPAGVYGPVNGAYHNWNRWDQGFSSALPTGTWEPNQSGEEDYAHITYFPNNTNDSYKWNDLPKTGGSGDYASAGYLIEFGDMPEDPKVFLSATLSLQVNTMSFYKSGIQPAVCEGTTVELNQPDQNAIPATYNWIPDETLSPLNIANPIATPKFPSSTYTVTGNRGACNNTTTYTVPVNPKPVSLINPEGYNSCKGSTIPIVAGDNPTYSYKWSNNATTNSINVGTSGDYSVTITTDKNCTAPPFTTKVTVHDLPEIDLSSIKSLICDEKVTTVNYIPANTNEYSITSVDNRVSIINKLKVSVSDFDVYPMVYKAAIYPGCPKEVPFNLSFFKNPKGVLIVNGKIEGQPCFGYNLDAAFTPEGDLSGANYEWNFGDEVIANGIGIMTQVVPLGISLVKRDLKLTVTQDGCSTPFIEPDILVVPNLSLIVDKDIGCEPLPVIFTAISEGAVKYEWNFGDNILVNGSTPDQKYNYQTSGFYDVHLKVTTGDGCANEVKIPKMVHVAPIPVVAFSLSPTDCLVPGENQISFTGTGLNGTDQDTYTWDLEDFAASEKLNDPQGTPGPFKFDLKTKPMATVGLMVKSEFGCESDLESIKLQRKPDFTIQSNLLAGCIPFEPTLSGIINGGGDAVDFNWDFGDVTTGSGSPDLHTYTAPGKNFNVILKGKSSVTGCANEKIGTDLLMTYPKPTAKFRMDNKIVYNDKPDVKFTDLSLGASTWLWDFGGASTSTLQNPTYHFMKMGRQKIFLEVANADLCTDTVSQILLVAFDRLFPPNGFSPNAPNEIDRVFLLNSDGIAPEGYHFTVLSRWNDVVFEAKDEIKGWDGRTESGSFAPAGAYVWMLNFSDFLGRKHQQTGTVTLVY